MRNAVLPPLLSSPIYNFGNNEIQMANPSISSDNKISGYDCSFCLESKAFNGDDNQLRNGVFSIPYQPFESGNYQFIASNYGDNKVQPSSLPHDLDFVGTPSRQRSIDAIRPLQNEGINNLMVNKKTLTEWKTNKRRKPEQRQHQAYDSINEHKMSVKKSQKLSDKITALQKLVSPYGKTDTASVLQEATLYIKLLQQQVQNLFQMLSRSSCSSLEIDGKLVDLPNRGLCLFPTSILQELSEEQCFATCNARSTIL